MKQNKVEKLAVQVLHAAYGGVCTDVPPWKQLECIDIAKMILRREARVRREAMERAIEAIQKRTRLSPCALYEAEAAIRAAFNTKGASK